MRTCLPQCVLSQAPRYSDADVQRGERACDEEYQQHDTLWLRPSRYAHECDGRQHAGAVRRHSGPAYAWDVQCARQPRQDADQHDRDITPGKPQRVQCQHRGARLPIRLSTFLQPLRFKFSAPITFLQVVATVALLLGTGGFARILSRSRHTWPSTLMKCAFLVVFVTFLGGDAVASEAAADSLAGVASSSDPVEQITPSQDCRRDNAQLAAEWRKAMAVLLTGAVPVGVVIEVRTRESAVTA